MARASATRWSPQFHPSARGPIGIRYRAVLRMDPDEVDESRWLREGFKDSRLRCSFYADSPSHPKSGTSINKSAQKGPRSSLVEEAPGPDSADFPGGSRAVDSFFWRDGAF